MSSKTTTQSSTSWTAAVKAVVAAGRGCENPGPLPAVGPELLLASGTAGRQSVLVLRLLRLQQRYLYHQRSGAREGVGQSSSFARMQRTGSGGAGKEAYAVVVAADAVATKVGEMVAVAWQSEPSSREGLTTKARWKSPSPSSLLLAVLQRHWTDRWECAGEEKEGSRWRGAKRGILPEPLYRRSLSAAAVAASQLGRGTSSGMEVAGRVPRRLSAAKRNASPSSSSPPRGAGGAAGAETTAAAGTHGEPPSAFVLLDLAETPATKRPRSSDNLPSAPEDRHSGTAP